MITLLISRTNRLSADKFLNELLVFLARLMIVLLKLLFLQLFKCLYVLCRFNDNTELLLDLLLLRSEERRVGKECL